MTDLRLPEPDGMVRDLHLLNGKLFPFLPMNEGSVSDYIDLQRMMFMLNENYRSKSFSIFGSGAVAGAFRQVVAAHETDTQTAARVASRCLTLMETTFANGARDRGSRPQSAWSSLSGV